LTPEVFQKRLKEALNVRLDDEVLQDIFRTMYLHDLHSTEKSVRKVPLHLFMRWLEQFEEENEGRSGLQLQQPFLTLPGFPGRRGSAVPGFMATVPRFPRFAFTAKKKEGQKDEGGTEEGGQGAAGARGQLDIATHLGRGETVKTITSAVKQASSISERPQIPLDEGAEPPEHAAIPPYAMEQMFPYLPWWFQLWGAAPPLPPQVQVTPAAADPPGTGA